MSNILHTDFYSEVIKGNVAGHSLVHKFGRNDAVPNGTWGHVNLLGSAAWQLTTATAARVKAGNVADDAAGAGAQSITIEGLDETGALASEAEATAGTSASTATTITFSRIFRAYITPASAGAYASANTAAVVIENGAGGTDLISIAIEEGQSQFAAYTIPLGKTGYLLSVDLSVDAVAAKAADFRMSHVANILDVTTPFEPKRVKHYWDGVSGQLSYRPQSPSSAIPALTDIFIEARGASITEASAEFELLLVDD